MFYYPSPVVSFLGLAYLALWLFDRRILREPVATLVNKVRLCVGLTMVVICLIRISILPTFMTGWAMVGALFFAILAWIHLRQRVSDAKAQIAPRPCEQPVVSPTTRLQEIQSEMSKLDAEKRELEKHPDANRF